MSAFFFLLFDERIQLLFDRLFRDLIQFMDMLRQWQEENQPELEVDLYYDVDPDGSIANKIYFESYLGQLMEQEENIKCYYADACQEAVSAPIDSLAFITGKYLNDQSKYFAHSMPAQERRWAFHQLSAMLTGAHVGLNDPYALAAYGGTKTVDELFFRHRAQLIHRFINHNFQVITSLL